MRNLENIRFVLLNDLLGGYVFLILSNEHGRIRWEIQLFKDIFSASQMHLVFFFLPLKLGVQGKNICRVWVAFNMQDWFTCSML